jgi:hypothetical protein
MPRADRFAVAEINGEYTEQDMPTCGGDGQRDTAEEQTLDRNSVAKDFS